MSTPPRARPRVLVPTGAAARELGVRPETLYRWRLYGYVKPAARTVLTRRRGVGKSWLWDVEDLLRQIAALPPGTIR